MTKLRAITKKYSLISHPNLVTFASAEILHLLEIRHFASANVSTGECNEITVLIFGELW